jgi:glutathione synthase/RimK-type ligase-like ATP-grasp enzyme
MFDVALVTSESFPKLPEDDRLTLPALADEGIRAVPAIWSDPSVDWSSFDAVVVRAPWDWYRRPDEFTAWLGAIDRPDVRAWNPASLMGAHLDKTYLRTLERRGARIVETTWIARETSFDLRAWFREQRIERAVVKPSLSANAHRTVRFDAGSLDEASAVLAQILTTGDAMLQPYAQEIEQGGELSFVFFGDELSHVVEKRPRAGDFRVQAEHGGASVRIDAPSSLAAQASGVIALLPARCLYARVDGVVRGDELFVMEVEIVEPELFFRYDSGAPRRYARALRARLEHGRER